MHGERSHVIRGSIVDVEVAAAGRLVAARTAGCAVGATPTDPSDMAWSSPSLAAESRSPHRSALQSGGWPSSLSACRAWLESAAFSSGRDVVGEMGAGVSKLRLLKLANCVKAARTASARPRLLTHCPCVARITSPARGSQRPFNPAPRSGRRPDCAYNQLGRTHTKRFELERETFGELAARSAHPLRRGVPHYVTIVSVFAEVPLARGVPQDLVPLTEGAPPPGSSSVYEATRHQEPLPLISALGCASPPRWHRPACTAEVARAADNRRLQHSRAPGGGAQAIGAHVSSAHGVV